MDINKIAEALQDPKLWIVLLIAFVLGAVGALTHRAAQSPPPDAGPPPSPGPTPTKSTPTKWTADSLIGGIAAISMLYVSNAVTAPGIPFVVGSLVAGYAGKVILDGIEAKTTATLAQRTATQQTEIATETRIDLKALANNVGDLPGDQPIVNQVQAMARNLKVKHGLT